MLEFIIIFVIVTAINVYLKRRHWYSRFYINNLASKHDLQRLELLIHQRLRKLENER